MFNKKRRLSAVALLAAATMLLGACGSSSSSDTEAEDSTEVVVKAEVEDGEVSLEVCVGSNPIVGYDADGDYTYGGDPSVLVDGDTVYLYVGHDTGTTGYIIREYLCYSTTDLLNWTYEGVVLSMTDVEWTSDNTSAWAGQVAEHNGKYYMYYCSWDKTSSGKQSIGVAVSDSPTGTFVDIGEPLVAGTVTTPESSSWNDIDPTIWIETDEDGEEHRYLAWGNGNYYVCELNEDMISVKDLNGDGQITSGSSSDSADIINQVQSSYTEGPWIYRRTDEDGNVYGSYYLFYSSSWREELCYATTDDLIDGRWTFEDNIMSPICTSNTTHVAVFDFQGSTYMIYHSGALPGGSGYSRVANICEISFASDGSVDYITETASGIYGTTANFALADGSSLCHTYFLSSKSDDNYPYTDIALGTDDAVSTSSSLDYAWVIMDGKSDESNAAYVSIQSENKPGLYWTANDDYSITIAQDADASDETSERQTWHTVTGLADSEGVSFESVYFPGYYLTIVDGIACLTDGSDAEACTFYVTYDNSKSVASEE